MSNGLGGTGAGPGGRDWRSRGGAWRAGLKAQGRGREGGAEGAGVDCSVLTLSSRKWGLLKGCDTMKFGFQITPFPCRVQEGLWDSRPGRW